MHIFISLFSGINDEGSVNGSIPCFYETVIKNLEKLGNNLLVHVSKDWNRPYDKIPDKLLTQIKEFNPDLLILFNNTFYDVSREFDCPIVIYEVDSPIFYSNKNALKENIARYKFIVSQDESVEILESEFRVNRKNILKVPFFTEIHAKDIPIRHNISFIGTKFSNQNIFSKFMKSNPNEKEIDLFKKLIKEYKYNTFVTTNSLIEKFNIKSKKILANFDTNKIIGDLSDYNRTKTLSCVADLGLRLYGTPEWIFDNYNEPEVILSYINKPVYSLKHNQDIYNSSKIGININHLQACSGFSWRVCDILASNACLVSEYKPNVEKYFGKAGVPTFTNPYEAREICIKLLNNENMRKDIVAASQEIIESNFRFKYVLQEIEDFIGFKLESDNKPEVKYHIATFKKLKKKEKFIQKIFSIRNSDDKKHKVITILGVKIKVKIKERRIND